MIDKILHIQKKLSLSDAEFCRKIGYRPQNFNQWKTGASPVPMKAIVKMLQVFENINADWVPLGRGEMFREDKRIDLSTSMIYAHLLTDDLVSEMKTFDSFTF